MTNSISVTPATPVVSVVLGSYNRLAFLKSTVESIRREIDALQGAGEIIVVDGGSTDGSIAWLTAQKDIVSIIQHNRGEWRGRQIRRRSWGYFMNLGFKAAQGKYICMVSDDCLLHRNSLRNGIAHFESHLAKGEKIGAVAFYWRNWPEQAQYRVGLTLGRRMFVNHGLYLNDALTEIGYIDEEHYSFYHADGDLCLKLWDRGWACIDCTDAYVEHFSDANTEVRASNLVGQNRDWNVFLSRWTALVDPTNPHSLGGWIERDHEDTDQTWRQFPADELRRMKWTNWRRAVERRVPGLSRLKSLASRRGRIL
ncbi:MAG: glycosyltransferase [Ferrovibrio sp.]|uniref:glycosyltransferase n=1 Tax=Ferrovibrio sp. TaxID=1917215 RepID=UPI00391BE789